jgi:hypothetical protein
MTRDNTKRSRQYAIYYFLNNKEYEDITLNTMIIN